MQPEMIKAAYRQFKTTVQGLFTRLHELGLEISGADFKDLTGDLLANIHQPYLFVVVGEVKSGKSSFVNALLGAPVCKVAPDPCTDTIQKIVYAAQPYERSLGEHCRELGREIPILQEIGIVDTPGTNSIVAGHQEITEKFIPECDLAIFVFPAVNPYAKTSWDLFSLVHRQWHKKIVFVLQQADRATPDELDTNRTRVIELARERGVESPTVFCVSAKLAETGSEGSGFPEMCDFIKKTVTGGRHYYLKMESLLDTAGTVLERFEDALQLQARAVDDDRENRDRIADFVIRTKAQALRDAEALTERLVRAYQDETRTIVDEFAEGLAVTQLVKSTIKSLFGRTNQLKGWTEELNQRFNDRFGREVKRLSDEGVGRLSANIAAQTELLLAGLESKKAAFTLETQASMSAFTAQRLQTIDEVIARLFTLINESALGECIRPAGLRRLGDHAVTGGLLTAVGAVLATTTHILIFDITGGVFATVGALLAATLLVKRGSIIKKFQQGFEQAGLAFDAQLREKLASQLEEVFSNLELSFQPYVQQTYANEQRLADLVAAAQALRAALTAERDTLARLAS